MDDFKERIEQLWLQVRPLYQQLHAYVRRKLLDAYPQYRDRFPATGHIPAHLTGESYKVNVAWNNCFRRIFSCCWRESTRPLQFFCNTLPMDQRKLIFWYRMHCSNNSILYALSRLHQNRFIAIGCKYDIDLLTNSCVVSTQLL